MDVGQFVVPFNVYSPYCGYYGQFGFYPGYGLPLQQVSPVPIAPIAPVIAGTFPPTMPQEVFTPAFSKSSAPSRPQRSSDPRSGLRGLLGLNIGASN